MWTDRATFKSSWRQIFEQKQPKYLVTLWGKFKTRLFLNRVHTGPFYAVSCCISGKQKICNTIMNQAGVLYKTNLCECYFSKICCSCFWSILCKLLGYFLFHHLVALVPPKSKLYLGGNFRSIFDSDIWTRRPQSIFLLSRANATKYILL